MGEQAKRLRILPDLKGFNDGRHHLQKVKSCTPKPARANGASAFPCGVIGRIFEIFTASELNQSADSSSFLSAVGGSSTTSPASSISFSLAATFVASL